MPLLAFRCDKRASSRTYGKLITSAKKVAMGEYIAGERFLIAFE